MPSSLWPNFIGQAYRERSLNADAETCVNLFLATQLSGMNAKKKFLYGTPGTSLYVAAVGAAARGNGVFEQDGRAWCVIETHVYELYGQAPFISASLGTVVDDGRSVSWASNGLGGNQVALSSAGQVFVLNLNNQPATMAPVAVPPWLNGISMLAFQDGFIHALERNTPKIWYSNPNDATTWPGNQFYSSSVQSDNFVAMTSAGGRIWAFGSKTTQAFYNSGGTPNPYLPIQGSQFEIGIEGEFAWAVFGATIAWAGTSARGGRGVFQLNGYGGERISTPAVEYALNTYARIDDCEVTPYEQEGHVFGVFSFPSSNDASWGVDFQEPGLPWHRRGTWVPATASWLPWRVRGHAYVFGQHLVGDRVSGNLGVLDLGVYTEYGSTMLAERAGPYPGADNQVSFLDQIELGAETGVGNAAQPSPQVELAISKDSGHTWTQAILAPLGVAGDFGARPRWFMLGRARMDRLVARIRISDPVKRVIGPGLWLRVTPGTGQR